jgi:hypothetical protein
MIIRSRQMKWPRKALACAAALTTATALSLIGLAPTSAEAGSLFTSTWTDGASFGAVESGQPGQCLGVLGGNMTNGTPVVTWTCDGNPDQTWEIVNGFPGSGWVQIQNSQDPNKCLGVLGAATSDGSSLVIWDCNGSWDQLWDFIPWTADNRNGPFGCYNIENLNADPKVIGALGGNPANGTQAVIWDLLTTHLDQVWCP